MDYFKSRHFQCYAILGRFKIEASKEVIIVIVPFFYQSSFVFFNYRFIFSYMSTYFSISFDAIYEAISINLGVYPCRRFFSNGLGVPILC